MLTLLAMGAVCEALQRWIRRSALQLASLVGLATLVGALAGWYARALAVPWPSPVAVGGALGVEVLLISGAYWVVFRSVARWGGRRETA